MEGVVSETVGAAVVPELGLVTGLIAVVSFILLVVGAWCVGEGGEILGQKYDASIIGGLVIAWLNTAPETIFFITALYSNKPSFAIGAISGSTIVVCTIAMGSCFYLGSIAKKSGYFTLQTSVLKQCQILAASCVIPISIIFLGFNIYSTISGISAYLLFLYYTIVNKDSQSRDVFEKTEDIEEGGKEHPWEDEDSDSDHDSEEVTVKKGVLYLLCGGILIFVFSGPFINSIVEISNSYSLSETLPAFFFAPIASEAPEILESISLSRKGNSQNINIAVSNLVGGTITKTTMLSGIFCLFGIWKQFDWESPSYEISLGLLSFCALFAASLGFLSKRLQKWHGIALFVLFVLTGITQYLFNGQAAVSVVAAL